MKSKVKKIIVSMAIATMLFGGSMLTLNTAYAAAGGVRHSPDSDLRGNPTEKQIVICHVPIGIPENLHTIHIGFSAWPAHRDNHGGDYLGSCNNPPSTAANPAAASTEDLIVINDCTGEYRKTLIELTQSYFDPIIVHDDAYDDDEETIIALSQCLDRGDSSDSSKTGSERNTPDIGKNGGYDSVSDSGNHHRINNCKNQDVSDSNHDSSNPGDSTESDSSANYAKKLKDRKAIFDLANSHGDSSINISDSSMDDTDVYTAYKACADANAANKGATGKGDSGHKYRIMDNCSNVATIKSAVAAYKTKVAAVATNDNPNKYTGRPIVIKTSTLIDKRIKAAYDACIDPDQGGGTPITTPSTNSKGFGGRLNWKEPTNK